MASISPQSMMIGGLYPFRQAVARLRRGSFLRSASVAVINTARRTGLRPPGGKIRPMDRRDVAFQNCDSMIMDAVFWFGTSGYEGIMSECWEYLCRNSHGVLEIGSNIGFYTILGSLAAPRAPYLCLEPNPDVFSVLTTNVALNGLGAVTASNAAAIPESRARAVELVIPDEGRSMTVGAHLAAGVEGVARGSLRRLEVPGIPMAELVRGRDLIKIDAEGIEFALLDSAKEWITSAAPSLVVEVLPGSHKLVALIRELCLQAAYDCYIVPSYGSDALWKLSGQSLHEDMMPQHRSKDVILTRMDLSKRFAVTNRASA